MVYSGNSVSKLKSPCDSTPRGAGRADLIKSGKLARTGFLHLIKAGEQPALLLPLWLYTVIEIHGYKPDKKNQSFFPEDQIIGVNKSF